MLKKNLIEVFVFGLLFTLVPFTNAQEKPVEKKDNKMMMQNDDMQNCMDKIASDENIREMMMQKMMKHSEGNSESQMKMCKMMMDNPEMHKMMMNMMNEKGMMQGNGMMKDGMMKDTTKTMKKSEHESHH